MTTGPDHGYPAPVAEATGEVPNVARIYDRLLGGAHNFAPDRERADELIAAYPDLVDAARANRSFLRHVVEHALELGVDQFLDIGSGIPTVGNVHEIAQRHVPGARVAYVDHDPVAVLHSRTLLTDVEHATITEADLRDPAAVITAPDVAGLLDLTRPVALLAFAVLHFLGDADDPVGVLTQFRRALAPGSLLALTHTSGDYPDHPELARSRRQVIGLYADTSDPAHDRSREEIRAIVEAAGFTVDADGLVDISRWAPPQHGDRPLGAYALITEPLS